MLRAVPCGIYFPGVYSHRRKNASSRQTKHMIKNTANINQTTAYFTAPSHLILFLLFKEIKINGRAFNVTLRSAKNRKLPSKSPSSDDKRCVSSSGAASAQPALRGCTNGDVRIFSLVFRGAALQWTLPLMRPV